MHPIVTGVCRCHWTILSDLGKVWDSVGGPVRPHTLVAAHTTPYAKRCAPSQFPLTIGQVTVGAALGMLGIACDIPNALPTVKCNGGCTALLVLFRHTHTGDNGSCLSKILLE